MLKHTKSASKRNRQVSKPKPKRQNVSERSKRSRRASRTTSERWTVGLDLGDRCSSLCTLNDRGDVVAEGKLRTTASALSEHFAKLAPARVALEAGTHSPWISRLIERCGHEVIVANPRELRKIYQNHRKNDRSDAHNLARLARHDVRLLAPIRHRNERMQADLALLRARDALLGARTKCITCARGLVKTAGLRLPKCDADTFAKKVAPFIPSELQAALSPLLTTIAELTERIHRYDASVEALAQTSYPETALLRQVTGVGPVTALAYVLTIADGHRFSKSRTVGAYLGLVPRQDDSGERSSQLPISKAGNRFLRRLLVGCAQYILGPFGPDTDLRRFGRHLAQRGGKNAKKRAVVSVARKLAVLLHRLWTTGERYEPLRNSKAAELPSQAA